MSDETALLKAIIAHPGEDMPRLLYADWLDENVPDKGPSPAAGPSARAEYIRVQCRLARFPYDEPDYPEWLEREMDLAEWLVTHTNDEDEDPDLPEYLGWLGTFDSGDHRDYDRGFPAVMNYTEYEDEPQDNIDRILPALAEAFANTACRTLFMEDAYGAEIAGVVAAPVAAGLRGFEICDIADDDEDVAVRAIAESPHVSGLRRLNLDFGLDQDALRRLARSKHLNALESFSHDRGGSALKALGEARWFRNLRALRVSLDNRDTLKALAELPTMSNLVSLTLDGSVNPTPAAMRKFAASRSFPRLARLEIAHVRLAPELIALLARGPWPLRHLVLRRVIVRKAGAEALAGTAFAEALRVLELPDCDITAGGVAALAGSAQLAGLRHLSLNDNPIGAGGLAALARSKHLRGLRTLALAHCNSTKAPLDAAALVQFLSALEMPELRHLDLDQLPVAVRGARVLGAGASFANLTRLALNRCGLREAGTRAIVESGALPNLSVLDVSDNGAGKGVSKLADPKTFPRLARANLVGNRVPKSALSRLRKRPGVRV